jgi:DNA primase
VFCFDGDNAGREAAWRALQQALPLMEDGRSARFLFLPEGQDPDTQVRAIGAVAFEASLAEATGLADFFFETLSARTNLSSLEGKAQLSKLAQPFLDKLPKGVYRQLMFDQLGQLTGARAFPAPATQPTPSLPFTEPTPGFAPYSPPAGRPANRSARPRVDWSPCMRLVNLLIRRPNLVTEVPIPEELGEIRSPDMDLLLQVLEIAQAWPASTTAELMSRLYATPYGNQLTEIFGREFITPEEGIAEKFSQDLKLLVDQYQQRKNRNATLEQLRRLHEGTESGESGQLQGS